MIKLFIKVIILGALAAMSAPSFAAETPKDQSKVKNDKKQKAKEKKKEEVDDEEKQIDVNAYNDMFSNCGANEDFIEGACVIAKK